MERKRPTGERAAWRRLGWMVLAGSIAWALAAGADSLPPPGPAESRSSTAILHDAPITPAPAGTESTIVFNNRPIATLRARVLGRGPAERARGAVDRIKEALERGASDSVTIQAIPEALMLRVGEDAVVALTQYDLNPEAEETLESAARDAAANLRRAIVEYREQRSGVAIAKAVGGTVVASILAFFLARAIGQIRRRLITLLHQTTQRRFQGAGAEQSMAHVSAGHVAGALGRLVDGLGLAGLLLVGYMWLAFCLRSFPYTRPWGEELRSYLFDTVAGLALSVVRALPGLFTVVLIYFLTRSASRLLNQIFHAIEHGSFHVGWIEPEIAAPTRRILNAMLWLFALLVAYPYLPGSGSEAFKGLSVFVGLVLSLGSSGVVNQAMSGFVLMYARMLKRGDYVLIGTTEGMVTSLGLLSTKIRTRLSEEVSIPNSVVLSDTTKNYSRYVAEGLLVADRVSISYSAPWRQVHAMLKEAAKRTMGLRKEPAPLVRQIELGDFYVVYEINAAVDNPGERIATLTRLRANIQDEFNRYGVQIMSPHYEGDPEQPAIVPPEQWHAAPAREDGSAD